MTGEIISHYKILEKLGEGGMGVVYKAHDTKLDRDVAIKFLSAGHAVTEQDKTRFIHEARTASALEHPHICTIHEIDETPDGQMFLVMPCYEGTPLNEKIEKGPLPISEAIDIAIQIADGLQAAHEKGIVHRDIKSSNIFITSKGQVKIMDFGLARSPGMTKVTKTGATVGTVPYMSPEQARGEKVDHRTDIWSLGVILYEMIAGQLPFRSEYSEAVVYSILNEEPEPLTGLRSNVPIELEHVVNKALEKNRDLRYRHTDELVADLSRVQSVLGRKTTKRIPVTTKTTSRNQSISRFMFPVIVLLLGGAAALFLFYPSEAVPFSERDWIVVADFENQTGDSLYNHALNVALAVSLQQSRYVNVFPENRIRQTLQRMQRTDIRNVNKDIAREVAVREGINILVVPSIGRIGETYSITANIVDPHTHTVFRSESVQVTGEDQILRALDTVAKKIRRSLGESFSRIENQYTPLPEATTSSLEALKLYVDGRRLLGSDETAGYELIRQAVTIDPDFAFAHADLGVYYYIRGQRQLGEEHFIKALTLMDRLTLRERLWIRAVVEDWRGNRDGAVDNYRTYLAQYPDDPRGWFRLGYTYMVTGRYDASVDAFKRVIELDSLEAGAYINIASCYNATANDKEALKYYTKAFEIDPGGIRGIYVNSEYGFLLARMGDIDKARETFELMLTDENLRPRGLRSLALLNMYMGKYADAIKQLHEAILINKTIQHRLSEYRDRLFLASAYDAIGLIGKSDAELLEADRIRSGLYLGAVWLAPLGEVYAKRGRIEEAQRLLDEIADRLGDYLAVSSVIQSIRGDQRSYHQLKGEIALARGDYSDAIGSFETAYQLGGRLTEPLAYGYYLSGNIPRAIETYREITEKCNLGTEYQIEWIRSHYTLGRIYEETGDIDNALRYYKRFVEIWKDGDDDLVDLIDAKARLAHLEDLIG